MSFALAMLLAGIYLRECSAGECRVYTVNIEGKDVQIQLKEIFHIFWFQNIAICRLGIENRRFSVLFGF
jgi:hypothetical protein